MSKGKIHFENEPFMARVAGKGDNPIQCTPVVYDEMSNCGIGVFYEDGQGQVWGMVTPRNLIATWRGTEVLRRLDTIEHGTLCAAYYTGVRDPHESDMKSHVEPTIAKIGRGVYNAIMAMPVPDQIVRAILDNQEDDFAPALYPITDEVRAGTIQWRQEFADAGIKHPDEIDAKKRAQEETVAKFERLLASYARSRSLSRQCMGMNYVEGALLTLVDKGANQTHPDHVLVALAGVVSELAISEFSMTMLPFGPRSREEYEIQMDKTKEKAVDRSASWLASNSGRLRFAFWKRQQDSFTRNNVRELLRRLLGEYFPSKSEVAPA
jgi:hypothetical protein